MADGGAPSKSRTRFKWRAWLRAIHRDLGYLAVGLTFVYALSGLAVNHISDWDPNFENYAREHTLATELPTGDDAAAAIAVASELGITEEPIDVYRVSDELLEIAYEHRTLHVTLAQGRVFEEGQEPRLLLRAANWLHLNRGKKAWTWFADGYAAVLLLLATSGMFMIAGKKGIVGRGAVLVGLGVAVPLGYLWLVGSP
jgi:uncharacterized protein